MVLCNLNKYMELQLCMAECSFVLGVYALKNYETMFDQFDIHVCNVSYYKYVCKCNYNIFI